MALIFVQLLYTNNMTNTSKKETKTRNWAFIMYPDSAPTNWKEILTNYHINVIVSPLHDKDINPTTNEPKKAHWHVVLNFDSVKTIRQVEEIANSVNGTNPIKVESINGAIRYLTHIDNPEKAQYKREDITNIGSFDIDEPFKRSIDKYNYISEMIDFIETNNVNEFFQFMLYCKNENQEWFKALCDSSYVIREYIKSRRNYYKDAQMYKQEIE